MVYPYGLFVMIHVDPIDFASKSGGKDFVWTNHMISFYKCAWMCVFFSSPVFFSILVDLFFFYVSCFNPFRRFVALTCVHHSSDQKHMFSEEK